MDASIQLSDASSSCMQQHCASLVHISFDILVTQEETYVSLGVLFENTTEQALENAVFSVRLPNGANISLLECEVEKDGGMLLGAPEKRLEGRYCVNTLTDGPLFTCQVGRVEADRDVVMFIKYNFRPLWDDNEVHMSLPLPGKQIAKNANCHRCGINLESKYPLKVMKINSSSHNIKSRFIARKARVDIANPLGQGDFNLSIITIDTSRYLPSVDKYLPFDHLKKSQGTSTSPGRIIDEEYAPMAIFEEYCAPDDLTKRCGRLYRPLSLPGDRSSTSATSAVSTDSALSFFLSDSESDSEYDLAEDQEEDSSDNDTEREEVIDEREKWFDFADSVLKSFDDLELDFGTEGKWLSGCHPQPEEGTSWLDEDNADDDEQEPDEYCGNFERHEVTINGDFYGCDGRYEEVSVDDDDDEWEDSMEFGADGRGVVLERDLQSHNWITGVSEYEGIFFANIAAVISNEKPKLVDIPNRNPLWLESTKVTDLATPATPPPTPKKWDDSPGAGSPLLESNSLVNRLYNLQYIGAMPEALTHPPSSSSSSSQAPPRKRPRKRQKFAFERIFTPPLHAPLVGVGYGCSGAFHGI